MRKTFCDICGTHIEHPKTDGFLLNVGRLDGTFTCQEGQAVSPQIQGLEMCGRCAENLYVHICVLRKRNGVKE